MAQVQCIKCGKEKDAISGPVYGGKIGEELKAKICNECWKEWFEDMSVKVINEYRLNLSDPKATQFLNQQMRVFLKFDPPPTTPTTPTPPTP
jgi:Fe-S cluster biosynthesis and repair protein YggX